MTDIAYLAFVLAAAVLGSLMGIAAHFYRSLSYFPEDLDLGEPLDTLTREDYQWEKHVVGAEWDDNGYWDGESVRNLVYYMASGFILPLIGGFALWSERANLVAAICQILHKLGFAPPLCF